MPKNAPSRLVKSKIAADRSSPCFSGNSRGLHRPAFCTLIVSSMAFISYAQNFEDVMLWRALGHVPKGTYIDVSAQPPMIDPVGKAFHELGWRRIHAEPAHMLPMKVAFASLAGQPVHWLKIHADGLEETVLRGWDSEALRPWVLVIKTTEPISAQTRPQGVEGLLMGARYEFACTAGLCRIYVAAEHPELMPAFSSPPDVFKDAETHELHATIQSLRAEATRTQAREQQLRYEVQTRIRHEAKVRAALKLAEAQQRHAQHRLDAMLNSSSWKITAPMRSASTLLRRLRNAVREDRLKSGIKRRIKAVLQSGASTAAKHPALKRSLQAGLQVLPAFLQRQLRSAVGMPKTIAAEAASNALPPTRPLNINDLTPAAAQIYAALSEVHIQSK